MKVEKGFKDNLALNKVVTEPAKWNKLGAGGGNGL
jgi:hypothetical protein